MSHADLFIYLHEWQNCQRDVTLENEDSHVFPNFPRMIHTEMHVIWLSGSYTSMTRLYMIMHEHIALHMLTLLHYYYINIHKRL